MMVKPIRLHLQIFILAFLASIVFTNSSNYTFPFNEYIALESLYTSTNGSFWSWQNVTEYGRIWNFSDPTTNPCDNWQGVTCNSSCTEFTGCHVMELSLSSYNLKGKLPTNISGFDMIQSIDFSENYLTGEFPVGISQLKTLTDLNLGSNYFLGTLPSIVAWTGLNAVNISFNNFNGTIPHYFATMSTLTKFIVGSNKFVGSIPTDDSSSWKKIKVFEVSKNKFTGNVTKVLSQTTVLTHLDLSTNYFSGTLPSSLSNCPIEIFNISANMIAGKLSNLVEGWTSLKLIDISSNRFFGTIPSKLSQNAQLKGIYLTGNYLTGNLPYSLGLLGNLNSLNVGQNYLHGQLPSSLFNSTSLVNVYVSKNHFNGTLPSYINLPKLKNLHADRNLIVGTLPDNLCNSSSLTSLYLFLNDMHGTIPTCFCYLKQLRYVSISSNGVSGPIPSCIGNMSSLTRFIAFQNKLTGTIPNSIQYLKRIASFNVAENSLHGTVPSSIGLLQELQVLVLFSNFLNGTIPSTIGNLSKIEFIDMCNNSFVGTLPKALSKLSATLLQANFSENFLTGTIPEEIGALTKLQGLMLYSNEFHGTVPSTISQLTSLTTLDLGINNLYGTIPESVLGLSELESLYLNRNLFSGTIPSTFSQLTNLQVLSLNGNRLNGTIPNVLLHGNIDHLELADNFLTGNLDDLFVGNCLGFVSINGNLLSGKPLENINCSKASTPMTFLNISTNLFSGTISSSVNSFTTASAFDISYNLFSGSLASNAFHSLNRLTTLRVNKNLLGGRLDSLFVNSTRPYLILDVDRNSFSGTLPVAVLARGNVQSFTASLNCFTGTLPVEICNSKALNSLLLDGLHSADFCIQRILPLLGSSGYLSPNSVHGHIPECLLSLPEMANLHLSGNQFSGSIGNVISPALQYLDLSYNVLTGDIPLSIWRKNFTTLSLSNNKLTGTIPNSITSNYNQHGTSISISVNRLSGSIPNNLLNAQQISILNGNMFSCGDSLSGSPTSLPKNDPMANTYECGSDYTNGSLLAFFIAFVISMVLGSIVMSFTYGFGTIYTKYKKYMQYYSKQTDLSPIIGPKNYIRHYKNTCDRFVYLSACLSVAMLIVGMPIFAALSMVYSTYYNSYIWTVSMSYLHGYTPAIVSLVFLICILEAVLLITSNHSFIKQRYLILMAYETTMKQLQALAEFRDSTTELVRNSFMGSSSRASTYSMQDMSSVNTATTLQNPSESSDTIRPSGPPTTSLSMSPGFVNRNRTTVSPRPYSSVFSTVSVNNTNSSSSIPAISIDKRRLEERSASTSQSRKHRQYWWTVCLYTIFAIVNLVVMFAVFGSYVTTTQNGLTTIDQLALSFTICLFKLFWGNVMINEIFSKLGFVWLDIEVSSSYKVLVLLFNVIVAPYLIIGSFNSNCFGTAISRPPAIVSSAKGATCYLMGYNSFVLLNSNDSYITTSTVFSCAESSSIPSNMTIITKYTSYNPIEFFPPFNYNYQCSSSLLSNFIFVQIIRFAMSGICVPWIFYFMKKFQVFLLHEYSVDSLFFWAFTQIMPVLHRPMEISDLISSNDIYNFMPEGPDKQLRYEELRMQLIFVNGRILKEMLSKPILTPQTLRIRMVVDLAMLLAFGVLFPPLTIVVGWSMYVDITMSEIVIARLISIYEEIGSSDECPMKELLEVTNMKLVDFEDKLLRGISLTASASAGFWAVVLFDMLGDVAGPSHAWWIVVAMCLAPYWLHGFNSLVRYLYLRNLKNTQQSKSAKARALKDVSSGENITDDSGDGHQRKKEMSDDDMEITEEDQEVAKKRAWEILHHRRRCAEEEEQRKIKERHSVIENVRMSMIAGPGVYNPQHKDGGDYDGGDCSIISLEDGLSESYPTKETSTKIQMTSFHSSSRKDANKANSSFATTQQNPIIKSKLQKFEDDNL